ncbi:MFS transporter, partial [Mycobacterium tuberculosis]|nr:MFS transporter [Mycobacterium tuberculosis]
IYATAAVIVFPHIFFPQGDAAAATLQSLATFAIAFVARPIGSALFGHFGDRLGRKRMLMMTVWMMGIATACIGLLPSFNQIGWWAPVLLVFLRAVQGFAVGGEWGGAVLMAGEHAPQGRRTFFASFAQLGSPAGLILSLIA